MVCDLPHRCTLSSADQPQPHPSLRPRYPPFARHHTTHRGPQPSTSRRQHKHPASK
ncbi:hypothetical protein HYDPIDRAFT_117842 [Hydnomerulius pinastri MD-312]|uniref:Uncharacterized protein n=1 Tax=Hydnomerulius pinastri MD-312 TaxID=994086 RepID=A0A0C9VQE5_9AGAM|nr:hypothetical protein HYDPIDRAFT_117842 [Hydnomerulius pinastri MD-312]